MLLGSMATITNKSSLKCKDIMRNILNDEHNRIASLQLSEAVYPLNFFIQKHNLQDEDFEILQQNISSCISAMKTEISKNMSATSNTKTLLIDICGIIETALLTDDIFHAMAIHLCRNTYANIFTSKQRIHCMKYIQQEFNNLDEIKDDLDGYADDLDSCNIIDELNVNTTEEQKWSDELNKARAEALKHSSSAHAPFVDVADPNETYDDDIKDTTQYDINQCKEPYVPSYLLIDCESIVNALMVVMNDERNQIKGMSIKETERFKNSCVKLMYKCSPNHLGIICDLIAQHQLKYFMKFKKLDTNLNNIILDFLVNKRGIRMMNTKALDIRGLIMKRMVNYLPFIAALHSKTKLKESAKPLQLVIALMTYRAETEIINAYKGIDYSQEHIICIDTVCLYLPEMMDLIFKQLKQDKNKKIAQIPEKHYHDPDFHKTDMFYNRIFGGIPKFILKWAQKKEQKSKPKKNEQVEGRFLLRIFILLGREYQSKGYLYKYPRCIYSLQSLDDTIKTCIDDEVYEQLVNIKHPIHSYPMLLAKKRYEYDQLMLKKELEKILVPKKGININLGDMKKRYDFKKEMKSSYEDNVSSYERLILILMETHYSMFSTIISPQKYKNGDLFFTRKMYNLRAFGIVRFMEEDILKVLPQYFEVNKLANVLEKKQLESIRNGRSIEKYCNDKEFEEYKEEFRRFNNCVDGVELENKANERHIYDDNDDSDDPEAVSYGDQHYNGNLQYQSSIISEIMDGK